MNKIDIIKGLLNEIEFDNKDGYQYKIENNELKSKINDIISLIQENLQYYKDMVKAVDDDLTIHQLLAEANLTPIKQIKKELIEMYPDLEATFKFYEDF